LDQILKKANWRKSDIGLVAVDIGPGSYTGLRVGLAIAKIMSYALKADIIGVSSLDALASGLAGQAAAVRYFCPVIDARWNQVYSAFYRADGRPNGRMTDYLAISPEDLVKLIRRYPGEVLLSGDGLKSYGPVFERLGARARRAEERFWLPRARQIAILGAELYQAGRRDDPIKIMPLYLRRTEAEINLKSKRKRINEKIPHLVRG
jgi:tRNA threonylcarbamoyladenosine biosynthesis protein TsaB